jgi:intracellular sulfur oxidation DsrE/DsrF family protein
LPNFDVYNAPKGEVIMQLRKVFSLGLALIAMAAVGLAAQARMASADYKNALSGVSQVKAIFGVSAGSAFKLNLVFWAVQDVYNDSTVKGLSKPPQAAVVFHGQAVKLLSTDKNHYKQQNQEEVKKFQDTLRKMKSEGVNIEVCAYALKVLKVDPKTVIPEVTQVGNGFVSIVGYQAQGYEVVVVP